MTKEQLVAMGLSEELANKVLEGYKGYVPKIRFDEVNEAKKKAEDTVKERDGQLEALKKNGGDVEALKGEIAKLQTENKAAAEKAAAELKEVQINNAVEKALMGANAKNIKAAKALLTNLDKAELDAEGNVKGLKEQIEGLVKAEESKFLFAEPSGGKPPITGVTPKAGTKPGGGDEIDIDKMTYSQMVEYQAAHPDAKLF